MKVSLICATIGRVDLLKALLESLLVQQFRAFELIVVDQSGTDEVRNLLAQYADRLPVVFLSSSPGLSRARNHGIAIAKGEILAFPDDDCTYYPDTLQRVIDAHERQSADIVIGRIFDRQKSQDIMRDWPAEGRHFDRIDAYRFGSSICIFARNRNILMDEMLGAGAKYGCSEDLDFCFEYLERGFSIVYDPSVEVWHPELGLDTMDIGKVQRYAFGAGGFYAKRNLYLIFLASCLSHVLRILRAALLLRGGAVRSSLSAIVFRLKGFYSYKSES